MYITTDDYFVSKNFVVYTFYGEKTCFCWNENKLVTFAYTNNDLASVKVLTAPATIKNIQCFAGRIFLICIPQGVYKLSRDREFAVLSKSAVGMGTVFYEVLTLKNKYLYLDNKQNMTSKLLFQLSSEVSDSRKLCIYPVNTENATEQFLRTITNKDPTIENVCIVAIEKQVLILVNETVRITYNSIYSIRDVVPVQADSRVAGLLLLTSVDIIIVMYSKKDTLTFEKVCLGRNVQAICAGFSQSIEDTLWLVYSDESKLYYGKKKLLADNVQRITVQNKSFACLQCYDPKIILGLTMDKELVEFSTDTVEKTISIETDTFTNLRSDMLQGTDLIMEKIYKETQELHRLNRVLSMEEDKLRRINLYARKHKVRSCPKISIYRIANRSFLSANFNDILPKNSWIVVNLKSEWQNIFCTKKIVDQETTVDIYIPEDKMVNFSQIVIDLIALEDEGCSWCLIKNYVTHSLPEKSKKKRRRLDRANLINSKIATLESFMEEGNINMGKLSELKRSIRREFSDA